MQRGNKAVNIILIIALVLGIFYGYNYYKVDLERNFLNAKIREELAGRRMRLELSDDQVKEEIIRLSGNYRTITLTKENITLRNSDTPSMKILTVRWNYTYDLPLLDSTREMIIEREVHRTR